MYKSWVSLGDLKLANLHCVEEYGFYICYVCGILSAQVVELSIMGVRLLKMIFFEKLSGSFATSAV